MNSAANGQEDFASDNKKWSNMLLRKPLRNNIDTDYVNS